ncbi:recombinase RecT [Patescibacteria group bacterium]|nr:recombinase RecT [Patescibacteria group bacterium]
MEVKQDAVTPEQWEEMKKITRENVCAICGAELQIHTNPEKSTIEVGCLNREHHGYIERTTYTQEFRRGAEIHPAIRDKIERKMILPGGQPVEVALSMIQTRFPRADMDEPSAALFLWDCVRLDLDPLLGEIFPVSFKTTAKDGTKKIVVQPLISEDGWLSLAARACPEAWVGPPRTMRLEEYLQTQDAYKSKTYDEIKEIAKEIRKDLCGDPEAYVWVAVGHRKDQDDVATYGWYKASESKKRDREGKEYELSTPARDLPGNQARVRAIKRWVREVFPEAKSKMKEMTATWMERAGDVLDIQKVIEAEYHIVTEEPPKLAEKAGKTIGGKVGAAAPKAKTQPAPARDIPPEPNLSKYGLVTTDMPDAAAEQAFTPPDETIEGEGFAIDPTWLKESQKTLKWSDDTMITFIISQYKVSSTSVTGALNLLTREQAEEFVKEINSRLEKQTPKLI